jgi:DNA-binding transcriptional LysR family regulator
MIVQSHTLFHPLLLRSFLAVADSGSFTRAARQLALQQSTISQHVARLEEQVGATLLDRTRARIGLSERGRAIEQIAREILAGYQRLEHRLTGPELMGRIRLGSPEEFAVFRLPRILTDFRRLHMKVELEVHVAPSAELFAMIDAGALDLTVAERKAGERRGDLIRQERLVWFGNGEQWPAPNEALPLVLYPEPSPVRDLVVEACQAAGRSWRAAGGSASYLALRAAVLAGIGLTAFGESSNPLTVVPVPTSLGLPSLPPVELVLEVANPLPPVLELAEAIVEVERNSATDQPATNTLT